MAATRVGELLRGEGLPVNEKQARALLSALGATDGKIRTGDPPVQGCPRRAGPGGAGCGAAGLVAAVRLRRAGRRHRPAAAAGPAGRAGGAGRLVHGRGRGVRVVAGRAVGGQVRADGLAGPASPAGTWVVSFFVTARLAGQADSAAFTDGLLDQLAAITGEQVPPLTSAAARDGLRRRLLEAGRGAGREGRAAAGAGRRRPG